MFAQVSSGGYGGRDEARARLPTARKRAATGKREEQRSRNRRGTFKEHGLNERKFNAPLLWLSKETPLELNQLSQRDSSTCSLVVNLFAFRFPSLQDLTFLQGNPPVPLLGEIPFPGYARCCLETSPDRSLERPLVDYIGCCTPRRRLGVPKE